MKYLPKTSVHYQFITGKITAKKLYAEYKKRKGTKNGVSILDKELYQFFSGAKLSKLKDSIASLNNLKLSTYEKNLNTQYWFNQVGNEKYRLYAILFQAHDYCEHYKGLYNRIENLEFNCENLKSEKDSEHSSYIKIKSELSTANKYIEELEQKLSEFESVDTYKTRISDLESQLAEYKHKCSRLENENKAVINSELKARQNVSNLKKEIKKLNAVIQNNPTAEMDLQCVENEESGITVEKAKDYIISHNIKIFIAGGFKVNYESRFKKFGITTVNQIVDVDTKRKCNMNNVDVCVVCINDIQHTLMYRYTSSFNKKPTVYYGGSNVEQLMVEIYKEIGDFL